MAKLIKVLKDRRLPIILHQKRLILSPYFKFKIPGIIPAVKFYKISDALKSLLCGNKKLNLILN